MFNITLHTAQPGRGSCARALGVALGGLLAPLVQAEPSAPLSSRNLSLSPTVGRAAEAEGPAVQLPPITVTATRTPVPFSELGSLVDRSDASDWRARQLTSLASAFGGTAGVGAVGSGPKGGITSLFLRGAESKQILFLVDGVRFNDPNTDYNVFLGGAALCAGDSLEIAHGPQSTLYGGEAIGGVVSLRAERGQGSPSARVSAEAGSYGTVQGAVSTQGEQGAKAFNFAAVGGRTDNERPHNDFESGTFALRLDHTYSATLGLGATLRGFRGELQSPGDRFTNDPNNVDSEINLLATVFATYRPSDDFDARLTLGTQDRRFKSVNPPNPADLDPLALTLPFTPVTRVDNRRGVLDAQATYAGWAQHRLTAGTTGEVNRADNRGSFLGVDRRQQLLAFFVQDEWRPLARLTLTGGLRNDDYDTFGRATTGRASAAWALVPGQWKLRASYGTGFRAPSLLDLYAQSSSYQGNPALESEQARGGDVGVDWTLPDQRGLVSLTAFETKYRSLINSFFKDATLPPAAKSTAVNINRARSRGLEASTRLRLTEGLRLQLAYTYLEAIDEKTDARLLRRPRHTVSLEAAQELGHGVTVGAGLVKIDDRLDYITDIPPFGGNGPAPDYTVLRAYAAWAVTPALTLKARVENLFNANYEPVYGYPENGFGVYGGAEWSF